MCIILKRNRFLRIFNFNIFKEFLTLNIFKRNTSNIQNLTLKHLTLEQKIHQNVTDLLFSNYKNYQSAFIRIYNVYICDSDIKCEEKSLKNKDFALTFTIDIHTNDRKIIYHT